MNNPSFELAFTSTSLEELKNYLLSKELFWQVTPSPQMKGFPMLTLGNLLLSLANLEAYVAGGQLSPAQKTEYAQLKRELEAVQGKWTVAWQNKASQEYQSRLRQWANYLNEADFSKDGSQAYYATEVRNRVLLELLNDSSPQKAHAELAKLDTSLQAKIHIGEFIWEPAIQAAFPQERYWFLYGRLSD